MKKNDMDKKEGEYHDFLLNNFCLTVPKTFVEETFCVSKNLRYRKFFWIRGGGVSRFFVEIVLFHSTETFHRGSYLCLRKFQGSRFSMKRGEKLDFLSESFCVTVAKHFLEKSFFVS